MLDKAYLSYLSVPDLSKPAFASVTNLTVVCTDCLKVIHVGEFYLLIQDDRIQSAFNNFNDNWKTNTLNDFFSRRNK